jgi:hypothetical protein
LSFDPLTLLVGVISIYKPPQHTGVTDDLVFGDDERGALVGLIRFNKSQQGFRFIMNLF